MPDIFHRSFFLKGPAGRLEALLWTARAGNPPFAALVCHPHPLYAGTMHNKVVYHTAKALHEAGAPVLRFNFRGVGLSEGEHDHGRGEQEDVVSGLDYLTAEYPHLPIVLGGFSFGAFVGLRVACRDARVTQAIGLGLPVNNVDMSYLQACAKPKLILQGGQDQYGAQPKIEALFATLSEPKQLVIVEGADHFFAGHLGEVGVAITTWLRDRGQS